MRPEIIEAGKGAGFDLGLIKKLGLEIKRFKDVDPDIQREAAELYILWWGDVYAEELRRKTWLPDDSFQPDEEKCKGIYEELIEFQRESQPDFGITFDKLKSVYGRVNKEFRTSSERFPEGEILLIRKVDGVWRPITLTRSVLWEISEGSDEGEFSENYPWTWDMVSNRGMNYEWVPRIINEKPHHSRDHKEVFGKENLRWNEDYPLALINHALTINPRKGCRIKGAPRAAVTERAMFAVKNGIRYCDTHSPLSGYGPYVRKHGMCTEKEYVKKNISGPLARNERSEFLDAVRIHANYGAEGPITIFSDGREADVYRSLGRTAACRYNIQKLRDRLEAKNIYDFSDIWTLSEVV